jgi:hypothetical protein
MNVVRILGRSLNRQNAQFEKFDQILDVVENIHYPPVYFRVQDLMTIPEMQ